MNPSNSDASRPKSSQLTFGEFVSGVIQTAWRRRWLIVIPILVLVPLTIAAALFLPRTYVSTALLLLQEDVGGNALEKSENRLRETRQRAAALERLILSDRVLNKAMPGVYKDKLHNDPKSRARQLKDLREAISVSVEGGQFIEISLKSDVPIGLGSQLDAVLVAFFDNLLLPVSDTRTAPSYMVERKAARILEAEQQRDALIRSSNALSIPAINRQRDAVARLRAQATTTQTAYAQAKTSADQAIKSALGEEKLTQPISKAIETLATEIAKLQTTGNGGPNAELAERKRKYQLLKAALPLQEKATGLKASLTQVQSQLAASEKAFSEAMAGREKINNLDARIQADRAEYEKYRQRFSQTRAGTQLVLLRAPERIKIVDEPSDPKFPLSSALKILLAGLGASIALGAGLAVAAEQLDESIRSNRDAERAAGLPVIATLPRLELDGALDANTPPDKSQTPDEPERLVKTA